MNWGVSYLEERSCSVVAFILHSHKLIHHLIANSWKILETILQWHHTRCLSTWSHSDQGLLYCHNYIKTQYSWVGPLHFCPQQTTVLTRDVPIRSMGSGSGLILAFFRRSPSAILKVDPSPIFIYLFIYLFMSEHNMWQNADAHVTLLWQCGNNFRLDLN